MVSHADHGRKSGKQSSWWYVRRHIGILLWAVAKVNNAAISFRGEKVFYRIIYVIND